MARFTFKLPDIGEGISEAEIVAWHVAVGDRVEEDQGIADMMTDKATVEMESPVAGTVVELAGEVGDQVSIGAALVVIETDAVEGDPADETRAEEVEEQFEAENPGTEATLSPSPPVGEGRGPSQSDGKGEGDTQRRGPEPHSPSSDLAALGHLLPQGEKERGAHVLASPAVRARAADLGIDLDHHQRRSDRDLVADLARQLEHHARDRRFHLDRRLVGHHVGDLLVLLDALADLDVPRDDLSLGDAFANVRKAECEAGHSGQSFRSFLSAVPMRTGPGK